MSAPLSAFINPGEIDIFAGLLHILLLLQNRCGGRERQGPVREI
jgi:hypothetical protein